MVRSRPEGVYASVSTASMDFIRSGYRAGLSQLSDEVRTLIALYAPLDDTSERGLTVSVNMIRNYDAICQNTGKPNLATATAIRLFLDRAANAEETLVLLGQYNMHSSMGMMVHLALAGRSGRSVVVEYTDDETVVTDTPAVTNSYLTEGRKQGIRIAQFHTRYERLTKHLAEDEAVGMDQAGDTLGSVSKGSFGKFESIEWSIVFNLNNGEACYYHRGNCGNSCMFSVNEEA